MSFKGNIFFILLLLFGGLLNAQSDFVIKNYHTGIILNKDGSFEVEEVLKVLFYAQRHGIKRDIPTEYNISAEESGSIFDRLFNHELFIKDIKVEGHPFSVNSLGYGVQIKIGDPDVYVSGEQIYRITYKVYNGIIKKNNKTELYWNLIGDHWTADIIEADFSLKIPEGIDFDPNDFEVRTGTYGSSEQTASARWEGRVLSGSALETLGNGKAMTIAMRFPQHSIPLYSQFNLFLHYFKFLLLPILMLIAFLYVWYKDGIDRKMADVVSYLPPKQMDSALAGFAIDIKANTRDAISLIPYFGHKGFLRLEQGNDEDDMTFYKLKDLPQDAPAHQKLFFEGLFAYKSSVRLSTLKNKFYKTLAATQTAINNEIMNSDYFTDKSKFNYWNSIWVIIVATIINSIFCFLSGRMLFMAATIILAVILLVFAYVLLKRSERGDHLFKDVKGFKKFIDLAEKDKLEFLIKEDPEYFDKTLPYAIAFNLTKNWVSKFKDLQIPEPQWYSSNAYTPHGFHSSFNPVTFGNSLSSSLSEMRTVMSSQPSSSGSSGSSGGGSFSGGGFGGGGGSSW